MTTMTATVPVFGDLGIIQEHIESQEIQYDDDGRIIGSKEYYSAEIDRIEESLTTLEADIKAKDLEIHRLKQKHEAELEPLEKQMHLMRTAAENLETSLTKAYDDEFNAPPEARMPDIWPDPPYGASLLVSLFDEPDPIQPPYGTPLVESLT